MADGRRPPGHGSRRVWPALAGLAAAATLVAVVGCAATPPTVTPGGPTATPLPPALQAGQRVFARYCNTCHPGGHGGIGHNLIGIPDSDQEIAATVRAGRGNMPGFGPDKISAAELQSLIDYIRTLK